MEANTDPNKKRVLQVGLYTESAQDIKDAADRIVRFNKTFLTDVSIDVEVHEKGDAQCERPHMKLRFSFPSREVQEKFWLE